MECFDSVPWNIRRRKGCCSLDDSFDRRERDWRRAASQGVVEDEMHLKSCSDTMQGSMKTSEHMQCYHLSWSAATCAWVGCIDSDPWRSLDSVSERRWRIMRGGNTYY